MLKKLVFILMLIATPFAQARAVLVCTMMQGQPVERCCCDRQVPACQECEQAEQSGRCCAVVIDGSDDIGLSAANASLKKPIQKLWDSSPDLVTTPSQVLIAALQAASRASLLSQSHFQDGADLYLLTERLRL